MICPVGSLWIVGFSSVGVGGRPIVLFISAIDKNSNSTYRNLMAGEIITVLDKDPSAEYEGWIKTLVSGEIGYILKKRLIFARRIDENW